MTHFDRPFLSEGNKKKWPCPISILHETTLTYTLNTLNIILTLLWVVFFLYIQSSHKAFICFYSRDRTFSSLRCSSWSALWNKQQWTQNSESSLFGFQFQIGLYLLHHPWFWRDFSTQLSFLYTASISFVCAEGAACRIQWRLSVRLFFFHLNHLEILNTAIKFMRVTRGECFLCLCKETFLSTVPGQNFNHNIQHFYLKIRASKLRIKKIWQIVINHCCSWLCTHRESQQCVSAL